MSTVLITGSNSGLGAQLKSLLKFEHDVQGYDVQDDLDVRKPDHGLLARRYPHGLDVLINCAGVNRIDMLEQATETDWDLVMDTNAKGIFMMTQACLPMLKATKGTVLNIVSNASHMPMTSSAAYNASKGAAHILTLQLARELSRQHGITVFGISPNKLEGTGMSDYIEQRVPIVRGWTKEQADAYQLSSLLAGEETKPRVLAEFITFLLSSKERHKYLTGCIIPYGA